MNALILTMPGPRTGHNEGLVPEGFGALRRLGKLARQHALAMNGPFLETPKTPQLARLVIGYGRRAEMALAALMPELDREIDIEYCQFCGIAEITTSTGDVITSKGLLPANKCIKVSSPDSGFHPWELIRNRFWDVTTMLVVEKDFFEAMHRSANLYMASTLYVADANLETLSVVAPEEQPVTASVPSATDRFAMSLMSNESRD